MANQTLTADILTQSIADGVAERLGLSSQKAAQSLSVLVDIKKLLGGIIDPNKTVQSDQKFPFVFSKTFKDVLAALKENKKETVISSLEKKEDPKPVIIDSKLEKKEEPKSLLDIISKQFKSAITSVKEDKKEAPVSKLEKKEEPKPTIESKLEKKEEPKPILFAGFTPEGLKEMQKNLPDILKGIIKDKGKDKKEEGNGLLSLLGPGLSGLLRGALVAGGGVALLLGGLAALVTGLQTEGPWKGTLKLLSRVGLSGGLALLKKGAAKFVDNLKLVTEKVTELFSKVKGLLEWPVKIFKKIGNLLLKPLSILKNVGTTIVDNAMKAIDAPLKMVKGAASSLVDNAAKLVKAPLSFIKNIGKSIMGIFGKGSDAGKAIGAVGKMLSGAKGIFGKMLGSIGKIFTMGFLKRIPVVGTVIGLGFAWSRFKSGDVTGGIIDTLSAFAGLLDLVAPGLGLSISIGLDVLNAFLDHKAGGATAEASKKKSGMIGNFFKDIGSWIYEKAKDVPFVGRLIKAGEAFAAKDWAEGLVHMSRIVPGVGWLLDMIGMTEEKQEQIYTTEFDVIKNLMTWIKETIWDKVTGFIGNIVDGAKESIESYIEDLSWDPRSWVGMTPQKEEQQPVNKQQPSPTATPVSDAVIDPKGGLLVSSPTEGSLFQLSKNDGVVAAPFGSSADSSRSSDKTIENILGVIANNTGATNGNLTNLIAGFNNLAKELMKTGAVDQAPVVVSNNTDTSSSGFAGIAQYIQTATSPARSYTGYAASMKPVAV